MNIKSIKTEQDYDKALQRAYHLMQLDLKQDSNALSELDALGSLITEYEKKHYPIEPIKSFESDKLKTKQKKIKRSVAIQ